MAKDIEITERDKHHAATVALLISKRPDDKHQTLARILGVATGTFSRHYNNARTLGFIQDKLDTKKIGTKLCRIASETIECKEIARALENALRDLFDENMLPTTHVVRVPGRSRPGRIPSEEWDNNVSMVADAAANWISRNRSKIGTLGVAWGVAIEQISNRLKEIVKSRRKEVIVIPLSGDTTCKTPINCWSATMLAFDIATTLSSSSLEESTISLAGFPAAIPRDYRDATAAEALKYWKGQSQYQQFVSQSQNLDAIISGAGGVGDDFLKDPLFAHRLSKRDESSWKREVSGDIGGCVFPKLFEQRGNSKFLKLIASRWLGLSFECLQTTAKKARETKKLLGVVIVCYGVEKANVLLEAIREKCINVLFIDHELAQRLIRQVNSEIQKKKTS